MNALDYIKWRGDISMAQDPLQEVDALIFSRFSYLPLDGIVMEDMDEGKTIQSAAEEFSAMEGYHLLWPDDEPMLHLAAENERFADLRLCGYVNQLDPDQEKQFAALTIRLNDEDIFVSFRGTDNTLVGWKEDLNMSFMAIVPGQTQAVEYLERAAKGCSGQIFVGGHSKGGNLAVYAAAFCTEETQGRIRQVYNMDGPGFSREIVEKAGYGRICGRVHTYVPQSSVVGMLLEHEEEYTTVHSTEFGLQQHNVYSWEVLRNHLITLAHVDWGSAFVDRTLKNWLKELDPEKRGQIIDEVFELLAATEMKTVSEIGSKWYQSAVAIARSWSKMDGKVQQEMLDSLKSLVKAAKKSVPELKEQ